MAAAAAVAAVSAASGASIVRRSWVLRRRRRRRPRRSPLCLSATPVESLDGCSTAPLTPQAQGGLDRVESALVDAVPELSLLGRQASEIQAGPLTDLREALAKAHAREVGAGCRGGGGADGGERELTGAFTEVDEILCALVSAIHELRESASSLRRTEVKRHAEKINRDVQVWAERLVAEAHQGNTLEPVADDGPKVDTMVEVHVASVDVNKAPAEVRRRLLLAEKEWNRCARALAWCDGEASAAATATLAATAPSATAPAVGAARAADVMSSPPRRASAILEAAVLSTRRRFEIYFATPEASRQLAIERARRFIQELSGLPEEEIEPLLDFRSGALAMRHLFEVASGLDSPILGEVQVLAQVKASYQRSIAKPESGDEGCGGRVVAKMLNAGVRTGKLVRSQTGVGKGALSVPSAAMEVLAAELPGLLDGRPAESARFCVVGGCGGAARLLLVHILSRHPGVRVALVGRSLPEAEAMVREVAAVASASAGNNALVSAAVAGLHAESPERLIAVAADSDATFVVASGGEDPENEEPLLDPYRLCQQRTGGRRLLIVDLSNEQRTVSAAPFALAEASEIISCGMGDLRQAISRNAARRQTEVDKARQIIEEQVGDFKAWLCSQAAVPYLRSLQSKAEEIRGREMAKVARRLRGLHEREREAIDALTKALVARLLDPLFSSMREREASQEKRQKIVAIRDMFKLEPASARELLAPPSTSHIRGRLPAGGDTNVSLGSLPESPLHPVASTSFGLDERRPAVIDGTSQVGVATAAAATGSAADTDLVRTVAAEGVAAEAGGGIDGAAEGDVGVVGATAAAAA